MLNIPGKIAWITMELPGPLALLYSMNVLPAKLGISQLPFENKVLVGLYVCLLPCNTIEYILMGCRLLITSTAPSSVRYSTLPCRLQTGSSGLSLQCFNLRTVSRLDTGWQVMVQRHAQIGRTTPSTLHRQE